MNLSEFTIGAEFQCAGHRWRCTDIGSRVVVAIRVDKVEVVSNRRVGPPKRKTLSRTDAEALGLLNGPPYGVVETVFDEDDIVACEPA